MNTYMKWKEWYQIIDLEYYSISAKLRYGCTLSDKQRKMVDVLFETAIL